MEVEKIRQLEQIERVTEQIAADDGGSGRIETMEEKIDNCRRALTIESVEDASVAGLARRSYAAVTGINNRIQDIPTTETTVRSVW